MDLEISIFPESEDKNSNNNYLYYALGKDERCVDFFNKFRHFYTIEENIKSKQIKNIEDNLLELLNKIMKTGITVSNPEFNYKAYAVGIGLGVECFKTVKFNNLLLDEKSLEYLRNLVKWTVRPPKEPFENAYNEWYIENSEAKKEYDEITEQLIRMSKQKIRTALFGDKKEIEILQNRKNVLYNILANGQSKKRKAETFNNFSYEQKELMYNYYELVKELEVKSTGNLERTGMQFSYPTALNKEEVKTAVNKMLKAEPNLQSEFLYVILAIVKNYLSSQFFTNENLQNLKINWENRVLIDNFIITFSDEINELCSKFISNLDSIESFQKTKQIN